jgi:putative intracellular protease/amidase
MRIAILPFDRFTALDAVGPYEVLSRLPGAETVFVAERPRWAPPRPTSAW